MITFPFSQHPPAPGNKIRGMGLFSFFSLILLLSFIASGCYGQRKIKQAQRPSYPFFEDMEKSALPVGKRGGLFIESSAAEPSTFNWLVSEDATSSSFLNLMFDSLLSYNPIEDKVVPGLAKSWEVAPDNKTFRFKLRKGLTWSDGVPITADDVLFSFACIYDPRFPNRNAYDLSVGGKPFQVQKIDELTVQIQTPEIFAPFLRYMSGMPLMPKHVLEPYYKDGSLQNQWNISTAKKNPQSIVGSGPFLILSYNPGERIVLSANPRYWKRADDEIRLPYIDYLIVKFVKDANASLIAFASGQTDIEGISPDNVAWVKKGEKIYHYTVYDRGPSTASSFIWFNQNPGKNKNGVPYVIPYKLKWFQNRLFRQAVSYGIDREGIIAGVLFGRGTPLWGPETPANVKWYNPNVKKYPYNPRLALELLERAGFHKDASGRLLDQDNHPVSFNLLTNQENPIRTAMATVFKENMKQLGIEVHLQFIDFGTLVTKISDSYEYEACLLGLTGGGDPADGMSVFMSKGRLHQWYPNQPEPATPWEAEIDRLMIEQLTTLDEEKRRRCWFRVQEIMSEEQPFIYLVTPNTYVGLKNKWRNVQIPRIGPLVWNIEEIWTP
ncbi:ABC transporter substrate-binding protein [Candidatus Methylacidiphilum infernorum]|uniref:ABC transporter substrate-binding protein n=1 Tax=Candidatus Methylacidiphilum infernorum TaxID=511746 RepID=A0ABX7PY99_9BACT|nr:ABC transporter substrate-binding protein [Candidatus Methylacidiphilum infernorum]QSR87536.1 ABC transporter substrate-binding protein [Candidatus Methylacidiphilum infernorum]